MEPLAIVCQYSAFSHYVVAQNISIALQPLVPNRIYDFETQHIPEKNVLFVGSVLSDTINYLGRFLPEKRVVFYGAIEGFPLLEAESLEHRIAKDITIVTNSAFSRLCVETVGLPCEGVVYLGVDMHQDYDKNYENYLVRFTKNQPLVLYVSGNMPRKGIDKFLIASKMVKRALPKTCFILHTGGGYVNIPQWMMALEIPDFWCTNQFGKLPEAKLNAMYKICDVYAQPSFCESFGQPMIEAFRFNKPVVAVDAQPFNEIVTNGKTGLLIPCLDVHQELYMERVYLQYHRYSVDALADSIITLLSQPDLRRTLSKNIAAEKMRFDAAKTYPRLLEFFK